MQKQIHSYLQFMNIYSILCTQAWADMLVERLFLNCLLQGQWCSNTTEA